MILPTGEKVSLGKAFRGRRGQSMVEFAVVAPLFFLLVFGITDFGLLFFKQETLQYAIREAGRYAVTGRSISGESREDSIRDVVIQKAAGIPIVRSDIIIVSGGVTNSAGGPRQMMTVSLQATHTFITPMIGKFFPSGKYTFTVQTTFMNEPFSSGG
jgi:Flp pilus assembly protein TadG